MPHKPYYFAKDAATAARALGNPRDLYPLAGIAPIIGAERHWQRDRLLLSRASLVAVERASIGARKERLIYVRNYRDCGQRAGR